MKFDIAFVTYNSKKWLEQNINSILKSNYNLKNISLYYYDNNSNDDTVEELEKLQKKYGKKFNDFVVIKGNKNKGFGYGCNKAAMNGKSEYIFFLNIDTEINEDTFSKLEKEIESASEEVGIFELRQAPYEHPKYYNPVNGYTSWASGACLIIKRSIFEKIKGFDTNIFMYGEDVELSWHVRKLGYYIKYLYNVPITHYSYTETNKFKENQFIFAFVNNLYLRSKYCSVKRALGGHYLCFKAFKYNMTNLLSNADYKKVRNKMFKEYLKMSFKRFGVFVKARFTKNKNDFKVEIVNSIDYAPAKLDPFYVVDDNYINGPLVSILVRTCGRPDILRETLISLKNQSYKNIEVVIVEDGKNISEKMIKEEFNDLNINYYATGEKVGRSKVGNLAMERAKGKYLNFLDDDDLFYPEHVQVLVTELEKNNVDIAYSTAFETPIIIESKSPYKYKLADQFVRFSGHFSRVKLYGNNITPIQAVMFKKEVFENCGGLDETIDALEDWDLWINFSLKYNFHYVEKTTSIYRVPFNAVITKERQKFLNSSLEYLAKKHANDKIELNPFDIFWEKNERR